MAKESTQSPHKTSASRTTSKTAAKRNTSAKTQPTTASVAAFIAAVDGDERRADCQTVLQLMKAASKSEPVMWGSSIIGFGCYRYQYASGQSGEWPIIGFSPRKTDLTLYIMPGLVGYEAMLAKLGKHKTGKSCLYLKRLADVDMAVLKQIIAASVAQMKATYKL